jgi:hypothetical protein
MGKSKVPKETVPKFDQHLTLKGKNVMTEGKVDDTVTLTVKGKITEVSRNEWDDNKLSQTIGISSVEVIKAPDPGRMS